MMAECIIKREAEQNDLKIHSKAREGVKDTAHLGKQCSESTSLLKDRLW